MANRILQDPNQLAAPNFLSPAYDQVRADLLEKGVAAADAVTQLTASFAVYKASLVTAWNEQNQADAAARQQADEQRAQELAAQQEAEEAERREAEKKRPKQPKLLAGRSIDSVSQPRTSDEGLAEAREDRLPTTDVDTLALTQVGEGVAVKSVSSLRASPNARHDSQLSLADLNDAWDSFIEELRIAKWNEDSIRMHVKLIHSIDHHSWKHLPPQDLRHAALMLYFEEARIEWHKKITNEAVMVDIGIIVESRLEQCFRVVDGLRIERDRRYVLAVPSVSAATNGLVLDSLLTRADLEMSYLC
ncbi:hypothetical protein NM688_g7920 [Phlebia brevispora]|uniref:Uncharacterized protein n=1 Tax=Phlebia brevispora TaxID=194682 RepID=A0ACC1RZK1_9APHY|nr:hypothetical protein NM688_g7920 [Phlebia brevispora]